MSQCEGHTSGIEGPAELTRLVHLGQCATAFGDRGVHSTGPGGHGLGFPWRIDLRTGDHRRADVEELNEILRKDQIKRPVKSSAQFLLKSRELAQVNRAPEPPGDKP